jgi:hypothetical protein
MTNWLRTIGQQLPIIERLMRERDAARQQVSDLQRQLAWEPGHFYSTIPSPEDIASLGDSPSPRKALGGVNLNVAAQEKWLHRVMHWYTEIPFTEDRNSKYRYYFNNEAFVYGDGVSLYAMLRELKPRRIVEVGSGFSSAVMLDVNQFCFEGSMGLTFIEPFPEVRLLGLMCAADHTACTVYRKKIQNVSECPWNELRENDILFIDSSHVSKCASDVNMLFFEVLPQLAPGVVVHVHDVFANFEYPLDWLKKGWFWNEAYLLRAFLQFNSDFEILFWPSFLLQSHATDFAQMPLFMKNPGSSFWMRRRSS